MLLLAAALIVLPGSPLAAQEIGSELFPEGYEVPAEDQAGMNELYAFFAAELGMSVEEALERGLTLTDLEQQFNNAIGSGGLVSESTVNTTSPGEVIPVPPGATFEVDPATGRIVEVEHPSSSGSLPSPSERAKIRSVGFVIIATLAGVFQWIRGFFARRSAARQIPRQRVHR